MLNNRTQASAGSLSEVDPLARLYSLHNEVAAGMEDEMTTSPIMILFREFEAKYEQAGDLTLGEDVANSLLDECSELEKLLLDLPASSAQDFAAKLIVNTRYGDFIPGEIGTGGVLDQALAILAKQPVAQPNPKMIELVESAPKDFDPIIDALDAYRDGMGAFNTIKEADWPSYGGEDAVIRQTYGGPLDVLNEWHQPAQTRQGAIAALRFIVNETNFFHASEGVSSMAKAALSYLERSAEIEVLFQSWKTLRDEPTPDTDDACNKRYARYRALQDCIIRMPPVTARDLAIQTYVDSDAGDSDNSDEFDQLIKILIGGGTNG